MVPVQGYYKGSFKEPHKKVAPQLPKTSEPKTQTLKPCVLPQGLHSRNSDKPDEVSWCALTNLAKTAGTLRISMMTGASKPSATRGKN